MAAHREALANLQKEEEQERQAEAQRAAEAAAKARREALTGNSRTLADAHRSKLEAFGMAERNLAAAVEQINIALQQESIERKAATALCVEANLDTAPLQLDGLATVRRLTGNIRQALAQISACSRMGRLGSWELPPPDPDLRGETWVERETRHTSASVEMLLQHAERTN
jgi:hypothetical protein